MARKKQVKTEAAENAASAVKVKTKTEPKPKVAKIKTITVTGKRKTSIAKATIKEGNGEVRVNKMPIDTFSHLRRLYLIEPLRITEEVMSGRLNSLNIQVNVHGGGSESQTEASRLAIAKALVAYTANPELKSAFLKYDRSMLVADVRRKEMRKPGDSKARKRRQTSYR